MNKAVLCLAFFLALSATRTAQAGTLTYYISAPGAQDTSVSGATVESFDGLATGALSTAGNWAIGAYGVSDAQVTPFNVYGGAGGSGKYLDVNTQPTTVSLNTGNQYFGFWWSAGDANNVIEFYDAADNLLATFTTADLISFLTGTLTSVGGANYSASAYYGNPNGGGNAAEPYAYVHLRLSGTATTINRVVIRGANFEADNLAVSASSSVDGSWVEFGSQTINDPLSDPVAADDSYSAVVDTPLVIPAPGVLGNDSDPNGDSLTVTGYTQPANGTVTIDADGNLVYTPNAGFQGVDTLTYTVSDGNSTATATVTITVNAASPVPTLSEWMIALMALMLAVGGMFALGRKSSLMKNKAI
ncbi:MAG: IPTL-CTERM sorting domain-containing protein [Pseudomonadota bacterium]|jgi:hypothetical protein